MSDAILLYGDLDLNDNVTYFLTKEGFKYPSPALKQQYADSALKDGQLPTEAWKFDNRVLTFSIFVRGTDGATLDAALRALYMQVYSQDATVTWCPAGRSTSFYFLAYRPEAVAVDSYFNTTRRSVNEAIVTWSGQAFPFGHTARQSLETTILSGSIVKLTAGQTDELLCMDGTTAVKDAIHNLAFTKTGDSSFMTILGAEAPVIASVMTNLLSSDDSSFEATVGSWSNLSACTADVSTDYAYLGSKSLKMTCNEAAPDFCIVDALGWHTLGYMVANTQYTFSARFKGVVGKGYMLSLYEDTSGRTNSATITADGTWQPVSLTKTTGAGPITDTDARVGAVGATMGDVVYWDDIRLVASGGTGSASGTISIPTATIGMTPGMPLTVMCAVNTLWAGNDGSAHCLLDMKGAGAGDVFSIHKHTDNKLYFAVGDKSAVTAALTATTWAANTNHIVIGTVTGGTINVYLAGTAGTPATGTTREAALNDNLYVGAKIDGTLPANAGVLVAGWGRVLTSEEIEGFTL